MSKMRTGRRMERRIDLEDMASLILLAGYDEGLFLDLEEITGLIEKVVPMFPLAAFSFDFDEEEIIITPGGHYFRSLERFIGNMEDFLRAKKGSDCRSTIILSKGQEELTAKMKNLAASFPVVREIKKAILMVIKEK